MKHCAESMTSRERVVRTLDREPTDRMPIDLGVQFSTGISAFAYWNLREYLGFDTSDISIPDMVQFLARVDEDILEHFHCDCILLHPGWPRVSRWKPDSKYSFMVPKAAIPKKDPAGGWFVEQKQANGAIRKMRMAEGSFFFDGAWLSNWYECSEDEILAATAREAERIYKETQYATMYMAGFGAYFGNMDVLCEMVTEPEAVVERNRSLCKLNIEKVSKAIDAMGSYVQIVEIADDMGMQSGPLCRPNVFERCCAPFIKEFCSFVHKNSDWKVFLHSCGSIQPFIPILIDCGVDVLNPVQISAENMSPGKLKENFGNEIIFWGGGCDTQNVLGTECPEDVEKHVRNLIRTFKSGGGYVFNQVHNIMGNVPPKNINIMLETAYSESFF